MTNRANRVPNRPNGEIHEQIRIKHGDLEADVDAGLAPLILEIWKAGITTTMSCEENRPGWAWIDFLTAEDAEHFLSSVARYDANMYSLYNRIAQAWDPPTGAVEGCWEYTLTVNDMAVSQVEIEDGVIKESCTDPSDFLISVSIRFPRSDLPMLLRNLTAYNRLQTAARCLHGHTADRMPDICGDCIADNGPEDL
jgi:hypothetical protein